VHDRILVRMKAMLITAIFSVVLSAHPQNAETQSAGSKPSALVEGHLICSDTGAPARGATVRLRLLSNLLPKEPGAHEGNTRNPPDEVTDFNGNYRFPSVAQGIYVVSVDQDGYYDNFGIAKNILDHFSTDEQKAILATFPQVTVSSSGSLRQDIVIRRGGSISGHVTVDSGGVPGKISIEPILVSTPLFGNTVEKDHQFGAPGINSWVTDDDRGFYRIAGLPQGKYKIKIQVTEHSDSASFGNGNLYVYAPEALKDSDAQLIDVTEGGELTGIDINIPTRLLHSISGTITQGGEPVAKAHISLQLQGEKEHYNSGAITNADGDYRIDLLPSGTYIVKADGPYRTVPSGSSHPRSGKVTIQLGDGDAANANIDLSVPTQNH